MDWARSERANLIPVARQAAAVRDDAIAWKLPVTLVPVFGTQLGSIDLVPAIESALIATRRLGDRIVETWVLNNLAESLLEADRPVRASEFCRRARLASTGNDDSYGRWETQYLEGMCYLQLERFSDALNCIEQALAEARQASDPRAEGLSLSWLGVVYQHLGSFDSAIDAHHKGLALLDQTQSRWHLAYAINRLAETYREQGRFGDAVQQYQRARTVAHEIGDLWKEAAILMELGRAQKAEGRDSEARQSWHLALNIFEEFNDTRADRLRVMLTDLGGL
jgi:tetratricopeptide (TPR) repeat protein